MTERESLIRLRGARRYYEMEAETVHALDGLDLDLYKGEFVTIIGASGSGKSTLLHVLGLLDTLSEGEMTLAGQRIDGIPDDELSGIRNRSVGMVFQQFNLLNDLSVLENIALPLAYQGVPRKERQAIATEQAKRVGLGERLHHTPRELSGGQTQRVAIARALAVNPEVIMADEPTGALDSSTGKEIMELFIELHREGKTIFMVTHDSKLALMGSRTITISDGNILNDETRTPPKLSENSNALKPGKGALLWSDLLRIGVREGLLAHKLRTALTMLGVIIGVASVIAMSSFSEGSKKKQADQIRALGVNLVKIIDKKYDGETLGNARIRGSLGLTREDAHILKESLSGIQAMSMLRETDMNVLFGQSSLPDNLTIYGVEGDYQQVNNLTLSVGRWFGDYEATSLKRVVVVGAGIAKHLKRNGVKKIIGQELLIGGQVYSIIGSLTNRNVDTQELEIKQSGDSNYALIMPLSTMEQRTRYHSLRSPLDEIQLQMQEEDLIFEAGKNIRRILGGRHRGVGDFELFIPLDILKAKQQAQKLLDVLSLSICAISLLVGGIGIMNIMLASVSERMKEIGIRRAIGARRSDIRRQFLCESILISFAGSIVGLGCAAVVVIILCHMLELPIVFSPILIMVSMVLALATGVVFGFFPAKHAAEHNVIEVLRNE
ncbi:MAG: ATP-binding cassette domain-containing protein [Planctomycetes bacterium]|nr:ATP-binding cassette domain-containing protein [Planctomycetota bacterium]